MAPLKDKRLEEQIAECAVRYKENYYRLAYSYVHNAEDALDIVQESVYKAILAQGTLRNPEHLKTWFYRIVVNTSLDFLRKQRKMVAVGDDFWTGVDAGVVDRYEDLDLQKALNSLPEQYRTVVILRYFEDLKLEEIAEILNENINTVKTRLYRSLDKLRISLGDEEV